MVDIYKIIMQGLTGYDVILSRPFAVFVYPEGIRADFTAPPEPLCDSFHFQLAQGVLTVTISGSGTKPSTCE